MSAPAATAASSRHLRSPQLVGGSAALPPRLLPGWQGSPAPAATAICACWPRSTASLAGTDTPSRCRSTASRLSRRWSCSLTTRVAGGRAVRPVPATPPVVPVPPGPASPPTTTQPAPSRGYLSLWAPSACQSPVHRHRTLVKKAGPHPSPQRTQATGASATSKCVRTSGAAAGHSDGSPGRRGVVHCQRAEAPS